MKSKVWIVALAVFFVGCLAFSLPLIWPSEAASFAEIYSDGQLVARVDLAVDRVLTVEGEKGTNVVTVRDGKIAVTEATCPDHYCMQRGFCDGGTMIVCLPNGLVIEFTGEETIDGAVG